MQRTSALTLAWLSLVLTSLATAAEPARFPKVAEGWTVELIVQAPEILFPTAIVAAPDGTIYLGQDPMDMPGPPSKPIDSIVTIKNGKVSLFADRLWAVMGLEWIDKTLYVVHAPFLSALTDTDGDGKADHRVDLMTGLGPKNPGFNGINDHIASGVRLGIDGFLYIAIGDKGIPKGVGKDGTTIVMKGGGVIRIRPDGTGLEIVSTGERNPLSVALTDRDEIFTYGNDDDSKKWPNSLTHHIIGGHYGYPYEFLTAPWRALPITSGQLGGSGTQGLCYNEGGLPEIYRGNFFFCEWGLQKVFRYELAKTGATFKVVKKEVFVDKGELADFRPFSIAVDADRSSLLLVDWAYNGYLTDKVKSGRLFRLKYKGIDVAESKVLASANANPISQALKTLTDRSLSVRLEGQRKLIEIGKEAVPLLIHLLKSTDWDATTRIHALWSLHGIGSESARVAIREMLVDPDAEIRVQALRSTGISRDRQAASVIGSLLRDQNAVVRREAAITAGRLGEKSLDSALYASLGDLDPFVSWSVRGALRGLEAWSVPMLTEALNDPKRRDSALALADESWSPLAIRALIQAYGVAQDAKTRSRIMANLAGQFHKYPNWNGNWFGTNPLAGDFPAKTIDWDVAGMATVVEGLKLGLTDSDPSVRRQAIIGLTGVGPKIVAQFLKVIQTEVDEVNRILIITWIGRWHEARSVAILATLLRSKTESNQVRSAALDALASINSRDAFNARFALLFDANAPEELVARALPPLGRTGALPPNDLASFLASKAKVIRVAALVALSDRKGLPAEVLTLVLDRLEDADDEVRLAAIEAVARLKIAGAFDKLLACTKDVRTRNEATHALALMPDTRALPLFIEAIADKDPEMRKAGESALLMLRDRVGDDLRTQARAGKFTGLSMMAIERVLTRFTPIHDWKVIGPFGRTTAQVFLGQRSVDFASPQSGADGRVITWIDRTSEPRTGQIIIDDFKGGRGDRGGFGYDTNGSPDLAAFAYTEIESASDRPAMILVGSSGSVIVTVNESAVLTYNNGSGRAYAADSNLVRVKLLKGKNRIMLRVRQGIGVWSFGVQISEPSDLNFASHPAPLGIEALRTFAIDHSGDVKKGEALFFEPKGVGCIKCHSVGGRGTANIGPDLTGLALKYDKAEIVRSVLEPSNRIATGYQPLVVATTNGKVISGLLRAETDSHLELVDVETKLIRIVKSDVEERRIGTISVMPTGLVETLSPVDFADLIAFLTSLNKTSKP